VKEFAVTIVGLKYKEYVFDFEVGKSLFNAFENDTLKDADLQVKLLLDKSETMIAATIHVEGTADLVCDRSLREFKHPLNLEETVYYKFGEHYEELSEDVIIVPFNCAEIDFSQLIYDTVVLAIPPKVIHPELQESEDAPFTFNTSKSEEVVKEETDPRWEKLKNLKFNKN